MRKSTSKLMNAEERPQRSGRWCTCRIVGGRCCGYPNDTTKVRKWGCNGHYGRTYRVSVRISDLQQRQVEQSVVLVVEVLQQRLVVILCGGGGYREGNEAHERRTRLSKDRTDVMRCEIKQQASHPDPSKSDPLGAIARPVCKHGFYAEAEQRVARARAASEKNDRTRVRTLHHCTKRLQATGLL